MDKPVQGVLAEIHLGGGKLEQHRADLVAAALLILEQRKTNELLNRICESLLSLVEDDFEAADFTIGQVDDDRGGV